jgi:hypothetical protein
MRHTWSVTETHSGVWWRNLKERTCEPLRCGFKNNTEINPTETGWEKVDWIHLAPERDKRRAVVKLRIPVNVKNSSGLWRNNGLKNPG